eukprot:155575_1
MGNKASKKDKIKEKTVKSTRKTLTISQPNLLIDGYIRNLQQHIVGIIPTTINIILLKFYIAIPNRSHLLFITHDNDPKLEKLPMYCSNSGNEKQCAATFKLFNIYSKTKQTIRLISHNAKNDIHSISVDTKQSYGHCLISNIDILPPQFKNLNGNISLLYRFASETVDSIAFQTKNNNEDIINGYVSQKPNNDPQNVESKSYRKYYPMIYDSKRYNILFAGGCYGMWRDGHLNIGEYNLLTNKITMLGKTNDLRGVWPNICIIKNDKLFICGGRTSVCMTDSMCGCSVNKSVELYDLNNSDEIIQLESMNYGREGHGCVYNNELQKVFVGGGEGSNNSIEMYDMVKNKWILMESKSNFTYRFAKMFCDVNNPNLVNICGFNNKSAYCECVDIRDSKSRWMMSQLNDIVGMERNVMQIII